MGFFRSEISEDTLSELTSLRERERETQKRNHDLEHMLVDVEAQIESMKNKTQSASDMVSKVISENCCKTHVVCVTFMLPSL